MISASTSFKTRAAVKAAVQRFVEDTSTAGGTLIDDLIDAALEEAMTLPDFPPLVQWIESAASVAAGGVYIHTPKHVREVLRLVDKTSPYTMDVAAPTIMVQAQQGVADAQGGPTQAAWVGDYGINTTIPAGSALEILSSGSDTRTVTLRGTLNGEYATVTTTLSGSTPVAVTSTWDDVYQVFTDSTSALRIITLRVVGSSTAISTIGPNELDAVYHRLRLSIGAGVATTYRMLVRVVPASFGASDQFAPSGLGVFLYHAAVAAYFHKRRFPQLAKVHEDKADGFLAKMCLEYARQRQDAAVPYSRYTRPAAVVVIP